MNNNRVYQFVIVVLLAILFLAVFSGSGDPEQVAVVAIATPILTATAETGSEFVPAKTIAFDSNWLEVDPTTVPVVNAEILDLSSSLEQIQSSLPIIPDVPKLNFPNYSFDSSQWPSQLGSMSVVPAEAVLAPIATLTPAPALTATPTPVPRFFTCQGIVKSENEAKSWIRSYLSSIQCSTCTEGMVENCLDWAQIYHGGNLSEESVARYFKETFGVAPANKFWVPGVSYLDEAQARSHLLKQDYSHYEVEQIVARAKATGNNLTGYDTWLVSIAPAPVVGQTYDYGQHQFSNGEIRELLYNEGYSELDVDWILGGYSENNEGDISGFGGALYDHNTSPSYGGTPPESIENKPEDIFEVWLYEREWLTRPEAEIQLAASFRIWRKDLAGIELGDVVIQAQEQIDEILKWAWEQNAGSLHGYKTEAKERFGYGY